MLSLNQLGKRAVLAEDDDDATQATTQDSRWRAGVNRQSQPQAQQHQIAASQAAAAKRTANAMPKEERNAKRAARARELYAKQVGERAAAAEAAAAEAAAARVPTLQQLNVWLAEEDDEPCSIDEWCKFEDYTMQIEDISGLEELNDEELEEDVFLELFGNWRNSDEYKQYKIENDTNQMDYDGDECEPAPAVTPA